jgi:SAM-dependent methyltransferase
VLGGVLNALVAPVAFNSLVEYPLAMVAVCLLLPPLLRPANKEGPRGPAADLGLLAVFVLGGAVLIVLRLTDRDPQLDFNLLGRARWGWLLPGLLLALAGAAVYVRQGQGRQRWARLCDVVLPLGLAVLCVGLTWGLASDKLFFPLRDLLISWKGKPEQVTTIVDSSGAPQRLVDPALLADVQGMLKPLVGILTYGLPVVLCYTFVERPARFGLGVGAVLLAAGFCDLFDRNLLVQERSFFGVLRVDRLTDDKDWLRANPAFFGPVTYRLEVRSLTHGTTVHGKQFTDPSLRRVPLTYYHRTGPVGHLMAAYNRRIAVFGLGAGGVDAHRMVEDIETPRRMAVIGLGTGSMAAYGLPGQYIRFYDIDPTVKRLAYDDDGYFTFVPDARRRGVDVDVVINDARLALENEPIPADDADRYGLMIVDAFSSDAIPIHLITHEALKIYLERLREDGILIFHISNRYLNLQPVLARLAEAEGLTIYVEDDGDESPPGKAKSTWAALARKPEYLEMLRREETLKAEDVWDSLQQRWRGRGKGDLAGRYPELREKLPDWLAKGELPEVLKKTFLPLREPEKATEAEKTELKELLEDLNVVLAGVWRRPKTQPNVGLWTDDYSNLLSVFIWR